jgi:hypothetical protein
MVQRLDDLGIVVARVVDPRRNLVGLQVVLRVRLAQFLAGIRVCGEPVRLSARGRTTGIRSWIEFIRLFGSVVRIVTHEMVSSSPPQTSQRPAIANAGSFSR